MRDERNFTILILRKEYVSDQRMNCYLLSDIVNKINNDILHTEHSKLEYVLEFDHFESKTDTTQNIHMHT